MIPRTRLYLHGIALPLGPALPLPVPQYYRYYRYLSLSSCCDWSSSLVELQGYKYRSFLYLAVIKSISTLFLPSAGPPFCNTGLRIGTEGEEKRGGEGEDTDTWDSGEIHHSIYYCNYYLSLITTILIPTLTSLPVDLRSLLRLRYLLYQSATGALSFS